MLAIIVYIPKWESFQNEWFQSIQWLWSKHEMITIFDGQPLQILDQKINCFTSKTAGGPLFYISKLLFQLPAKNTLLLRQGFPLTEELLERLVEEKSDSLAISYSETEDSLSDGCLLFSTKASIPIWKKVQNLLFSGYSTHFQALLQKAGFSYKTLPLELKNIYQIEEPSLYIQQQMSNILAGLLRELKSKISIPSFLPEPQREKVSIVVLVWNNLKVTIPCLLSIMKFTKHPFELIIVDNGSIEPVDKWVQKNLGRYENVIYHRNEINQGFPQGCNDGMAIATGEHILLLNNDTIVTPFWLTRQVAAFSDPTIGLIGPLSINNNTQQNVLSFLKLPKNKKLYNNPKEMLSFAKQYTRKLLGLLTKDHSLVGLCLMIRKEVWKKLGGMDPIYGFGNFEDSDYNYRNNRLGYVSAICNDVFIDHVGSSTFAKSNLPYEKLFFQNFTYSCYKHNIPFGKEHNFVNFMSQGRGKRIWDSLRDNFEEQDSIPFHIHECLEHFTPLPHPFPKEKTLLAYPGIYDEEWQDTVLEAIQKDWHIILRIEPPTPYLEEQFIEKLKSFEPKIQKQIFLDTHYLPTIKRGAIYERVSGVLKLPRFDWFRLEREATSINLPIIQF